MEYKISEIELANIRNIKYGKISFHDEEQTSNIVTGIYGQNASGKSSIIKAIDFLRKMVDYRYSFDNSDLLIHFDSDTAKIRIQICYNNQLIDYIINVRRNEELVNFESEQILVDGDCILDVDHSAKKVIVNKLIGENSALEMTVLSEIAYESGKSLLGSKYAFNLLSKSDASNYPNAVKAIYMLSTKVNIISDHDSSSNNIDDNLVIFDLNQDGIDDLTIDLDNKGLISKKQYSKLEHQFSNLNKVISAIVPNIRLVINIEERSEEFVRLGYYTKRDGIEKLIPLSEESYGIKKIISLAFSLMQVMNKPDFILIVDELDAGIFEYLLGQLIEVIDSYAQGQLIFTSHNLRAVEVLGSESVVFTTSNSENAFIKIPPHEQLNNMRDTYYRSIILEGNEEKLYTKTFDNDILLGLMSNE